MSIICWCILGTRDAVSVPWLLGMCKRRYAGYLRIVLTSYREKVPFYERNGFLPARTQEAVRLIPPTFGETGIEQEEGE